MNISRVQDPSTNHPVVSANLPHNLKRVATGSLLLAVISAIAAAVLAGVSKIYQTTATSPSLGLSLSTAKLAMTGVTGGFLLIAAISFLFLYFKNRQKNTQTPASPSSNPLTSGASSSHSSSSSASVLRPHARDTAPSTTSATPASPNVRAIPASPTTIAAPAPSTTSTAPASPNVRAIPASPTTIAAPNPSSTNAAPASPNVRAAPASPSIAFLPSTPSPTSEDAASSSSAPKVSVLHQGSTSETLLANEEESYLTSVAARLRIDFWIRQANDNLSAAERAFQISRQIAATTIEMLSTTREQSSGALQVELTARAALTRALDDKTRVEQERSKAQAAFDAEQAAAASQQQENPSLDDSIDWAAERPENSYYLNLTQDQQTLFEKTLQASGLTEADYIRALHVFNTALSQEKTYPNLDEEAKKRLVFFDRALIDSDNKISGIAQLYDAIDYFMEYFGRACLNESDRPRIKFLVDHYPLQLEVEHATQNVKDCQSAYQAAQEKAKTLEEQIASLETKANQDNVTFGREEEALKRAMALVASARTDALDQLRNEQLQKQQLCEQKLSACEEWLKRCQDIELLLSQNTEKSLIEAAQQLIQLIYRDSLKEVIVRPLTYRPLVEALERHEDILKEEQELQPLLADAIAELLKIKEKNAERSWSSESAAIDRLTHSSTFLDAEIVDDYIRSLQEKDKNAQIPACFQAFQTSFRAKAFTLDRLKKLKKATQELLSSFLHEIPLVRNRISFS